MSLKNSHNPDKELNDEDRLNNDGDIKYLKSLLTKDDKIVFRKVHKVFRDLSDNGDLIFLSFILKISKPENIEFYDKFLNNKGFGKEYLDKVIGYVTNNIEKVLENKELQKVKKTNTEELKKNKEIEKEKKGKIKDKEKVDKEKRKKNIIEDRIRNKDKIIIIYDVLIEKIGKSKSIKDLDEIYKTYENIRGLKVVGKNNIEEIKIKKKDFFRIFGLRKIKLINK